MICETSKAFQRKFIVFGDNYCIKYCNILIHNDNCIIAISINILIYGIYSLEDACSPDEGITVGFAV